DREEVAVDLVIECDHLAGELLIALLERAVRSVDGAQDALPHLLELRLDLLERGVDRHREPAYYGPSGVAPAPVTTSSPPRNAGVSHLPTAPPYRPRRTLRRRKKQMPRNGKLVRIAFALVAAALVGALAVASAGAAGKRSTGTL